MCEKEYSFDFEEEWKREQLEILKREVEKEDPILQNISAVTFFSFSNGRGRRKRRIPRKVTLVKLKHSKRWYSWSGGGFDLPWDKWATEIIGSQERVESESNDRYLVSPGDWLRRRVEEYLREYNGRF